MIALPVISDGAIALARWLWTMLGETTVRGTAIILIAAGILRLWPRTSAAQRHLVWTVACCSILALPVLRLIIPEQNIRILPTNLSPSVVGYAPNRLTRSNAGHIPVVTERIVWDDAIRRNRSSSVSGHDVRGDAIFRDRNLSVTRRDVRDDGIPHGGAPYLWVLLGVGVWMGGTLIVLTTLLRAHWRVRQFMSTTTLCTDSRVHTIFSNVVRDVHITERIPLRYHTSTIPMVCGVFRHVIILPDSANNWADSRLRNVLLHEAAHIKRSDSLTQTIAQIICALYWFNPLMWMTARCLLVEREQACDDIVLAAGIRPSAYAVDLLELSQLFHQMHNASLSALTFVRPSQLYMRLQAVINSTQNRRVVTKHRAVLMWGAALGVVYPIGSITLQPKIQHQKIQPSFGTEIVIPHIPCCTLPSGENNFHQLYDSREMQQMKALPYTALTAATLAAVTPASKHVPHITTSIAAHSIVDAATPKKVAGVDTIGDNADTSGQETTGDYVDIVSDNDQIIEHVPGGTRFSFKPSEQLVVTVHGDPLTIVDGIPSRETSKSLFKHFDPKKIKTVDVLSIAESIKRYGDAAKKGAIVVTTFK